jgi:hypothetical protein
MYFMGKSCDLFSLFVQINLYSDVCLKLELFSNQSSGYDVYRRHAVLCIVVTMMSIDVTHVSNHSVVDIMPVSNGNLYFVLARCSGNFRV